MNSLGETVPLNMQLQGKMPGEPQILLPVFSGANSKESKFQLESQGEEVHPYMSLYYPLFAAHVESEKDRAKPDKTQTSKIQRRPVQYATRIYDVDAQPPKATTISNPSGTEPAAALQGGPRKKFGNETEPTAKTPSSNASSGTTLPRISPSSKTREPILLEESPPSHLPDERSGSRTEPKDARKKRKHKKERRRKKRLSSKRKERRTSDENRSTRAPFAPEGSTTVETQPLPPPNKSHKIRNESISEDPTELVKKKRKRAMAGDPMNCRSSKRKRKPSVCTDSDENASSLGTEKIAEQQCVDDKKPSALPNARNLKRRRNSTSMGEVSEEDTKNEEHSNNNSSKQDDKTSLQLVETLTRRYPKRKREPTALFVSNKNESEKSSKNDSEKSDRIQSKVEYYSDSDEYEFEDTDENLNYSDSGDDDEDFKPYSRSKVKKKEKKEKLPYKRKKKARKPQDIYPNGRYGVDYEKLAKEKYVDDYTKDIKTDNGEFKDRNWNLRFQQYLAYWRKYKTHHIRRCKKFHHLVMWAQVQRNVFRLKLMHPDRFRRLNSIGFLWKPKDYPTWMETFEKLEEKDLACLRTEFPHLDDIHVMDV